MNDAGVGRLPSANLAAKARINGIINGNTQ